MAWVGGTPLPSGGADFWDDVPGLIIFDEIVEEKWYTFLDGVSATTGATVTGLVNGRAYEFRVAAVNAVGQAGWSNIAGPYTPAAGGTVHTFIGTTSILAFYLGSTAVSKMYLGSTQVFPAS